MSELDKIRMQPIEHAANEFGGLSELAKALGVKYGTAWKWRHRNSIPTEMHKPILDLSKKKGFDIKAEDLIVGRYLYLSNIIDRLEAIKFDADDISLKSRVLSYAFGTKNPYDTLVEFSESGIKVDALNVVSELVVKDLFNAFFDELENIRHLSGEQIPRGCDTKRFMVDLGVRHVSNEILRSVMEGDA